jgi:hypothetical protein
MFTKLSSVSPARQFSKRFLSSAAGKPFRTLGLQQIAIGSPDKTRLRTLWVDLLGAADVHTFKSEKENVDEDITSLGRGLGTVEIDLMQPLGKLKLRRVCMRMRCLLS